MRDRLKINKNNGMSIIKNYHFYLIQIVILVLGLKIM